MCKKRYGTGDHSFPEVCDEGLAFYAEVLKERPQQGECPECLISLGLLQRLEDGCLVAIPPGLATNTVLRPMEQVIEQTQRGLASARTSMHRAEEIYRSSTHSGGGLVRVIHGAEVISTALGSAVRSCRQEMLTAQPGGGRPQEILEEALGRDLEALQRGVKRRTIYQHTVRTHGPTLSYVEQVSTAGAEVRTLNEMFDRLIVCDRQIAFVPDPAEERRHTALAIEHPGLIRYLVGVFEHSWERAVPIFHTPSSHRPTLLVDETRRVILQLMVNGYTDETIAGRLGVSARTVASHVRKASELFGSRSRAQLAYLIAKAGLLDDLPDETATG